MLLKNHFLYFLFLYLILNPLAAYSSCSTGQIKRIDEKITKQYTIARWKGRGDSKYSKCELFQKNRKTRSYIYKCGDTLFLRRSFSDSDCGWFADVVSLEGVVISGRYLEGRGGSFCGSFYGMELEAALGRSHIEITEKWLDSLTHLERRKGAYGVLTSPELPWDVEQRAVQDVYTKYKCLNVSF